MLSLITGASSGIGRDMARYLNKLGYDIIITARSEDKLKELKDELDSKKNGKVDVIISDLSKEEECIKLYNEVKAKYKNIDLLVNNAGFGLFGEFNKADLDRELSMIDTNIKGLHILMKLFLADMIKEDKGKILNVASIAGFMPGPLMSTYYASKAYVIRLSQAIREELKKEKSKVQISVLCPGPVDTNFNKVADVNFNASSLTSEKVAKYAIDKTLKGKFIIIPGFSIKCIRFLSKIMPDSIMAKACFKIQEKRKK